MDIHIREKDKMNKTINCIFHFVIPLTNNAVGVPWNQVIQKSKSPEPLMPDNDTTENANISAVTMSDPLIEQYLQYLASQGVIEPARIQEILNG